MVGYLPDASREKYQKPEVKRKSLLNSPGKGDESGARANCIVP
jgi:hypothetical protein